jgi:hypothetical protein
MLLEDGSNKSPKLFQPSKQLMIANSNVRRTNGILKASAIWPAEPSGHVPHINLSRMVQSHTYQIKPTNWMYNLSPKD